MNQKSSTEEKNLVPRKLWVKPTATIYSLADAQQGSTVSSSDSAFGLS